MMKLWINKYDFFKGMAFTFVMLIGIIWLAGCSNTQTEYFDNGQIKSEAHMRGGHYNGKTVWYYKNGVRQYEVNYVNDSLEGKATRWYMNGKKQSISNYSHDRLDGLQQSFDLNGKKTKEQEYHLDTLHGKSIEYYPSGKPRIEGQYNKGVYDGKWFYYSDDGTIVGLGEFKNGKGKQRAWYLNGPIKREVHYLGNEKHGDEKWFLPDGRLQKIIRYDHGQLVSVKEIIK